MLNKFNKYNITINQCLLLIFLILNIGFYYEKFAIVLPLSYGLLLIGLILQLRKNNTINYKDFILYSISFLLFTFLSYLWSYNPNDTLIFSKLLMKSIIISLLYTQLITSLKDLRIAFLGLGIGSLIYVIIYISLIDFDSLGDGRLQQFKDGSTIIPNLNLVGIFGCFSFTYFLFSYFINKNKIYIIASLISFLCVALLGSRKSILIMILSIILLFPKLGIRYRIFLIFLVLIIGICTVYFIPSEYLQFIINRFGSLIAEDSLDSSDKHRLEIIENSINFIEMNPFIGNGYYNFSALNYNYYGSKLYSHNNFIEIFVGVGIIGFILFYSMYIYIFNRLYIIRSFESRLYFIIFLSIFFNHNFIVISNEKFIWILLATFFIYIKLNNINNNERKYSIKNRIHRRST